MSLKLYSGKIFEIFKLDGAREGFGTLKDLSVQWIHSFSGMATLTVAGCAAMVAAYKALDKQFNLTFDTAVSNTENHLSTMNSAKDEVNNLKTEAEGYKDTLSSIADTYNIDITGVDTLAELIDKIRSASDVKLSLTDQAQLSQIESENKALERQIELKNKIVTSEQKQAAEDAKDALNRLTDNPSATTKPSTTDGKYTTYAEQFQMGAFGGNDTTLQQSVTNSIKSIRQYTQEIDDLKEKQKDLDPKSSAWKNAEKDIESYTNTIDKLKESLDENAVDLSTFLSAFSVNGEGTTALVGFEEEFNIVKKLIDDINNMDLSPAEQALASIESFFDGSTGKNFLKDELLEIAKSGDITEDSLSRIGISLEDIGLSGEEGLSSLNDYFRDLVKSADEANSSVKEFSGSLESITNAGETENQDKNWNTVSDLFNKAKELDKNKKWGTDDFKSMAQFIAPDNAQITAKNAELKAKDYKDLWDKYKSNFEKYFDTDNPLQSAINTQEKLIKSGLGTNGSDGIIKWSESFKTSADAAKALGISVEAAEIAMHNLESYGAEFDGVMFSNEKIDEYKSSLDGIKSIYDSLGEGTQKDRLGALINGFDQEYSSFENDISKLTEEQVIHIKFEYDLASIQQQIDELKEKAKAEGGKNSVTNAEIIAANNKYLDTASKGTGVDKLSIEYQTKLKVTDSSIDDLYAQLSEVEKGSDRYFEIQAEIQNTQDLQKSIYGLFSEQHPEINVDSNAEDVENAWKDFFSKPQQLKVDAKLDNSTVEAQLNELAAGSTITFKADVNGDSVDDAITAVKNQDGTISYTADVNGVDVPVSVTEKDGKVNYKANTSNLPNSFPPIKRTVNYVASGVQSAINVIKNVAQKSSGTLLSPAHAYGTVRQRASENILAPAYANGRVSLPKNENALVNELGTESLIRNGVWSLLPGGMHIESLKKGDIILNAKQTNDLLNSGKTFGHARAYASGTILAPAYGNGMLDISNSGYVTKSKSYSSSTPKSSKKSSSKAAQAAAKAAEDLFDFVEILLDRTKETTERLTDAIDDAVGLADKMSKNSSALTQVQKEISVNQQAYQKYMAQANAVGLAEGYASQIRNGSLNIENITNEDLKKKIDEYQNWYDKAKDCQDAIRDLQKDEKDLAIDRLEYIEDYYDSIIKLNDAYKDVNDARIEFNDAIGNTAIGAEVQSYLKSSYDKQYDSYNKALIQLSDYQNEFNELVRNGYINEGSEAWYDGQQKIQEFTKQVDESAIALIELEDKIREIDYTRLQQLIDGSDRRTDQLKNAQSLAEARDEQIVRDEYQKQVDELSKSINANYALREAKIQEQNLYDVTSTRYQELAEEISKIDGEIYGSLEDIEDLKNKIFETEFFNYEKEQSNLEYYIGELDDFAKLLNSDAYFDKTGAFTDEAYAKISLTADAMSKCRQATANATEALKKLDEMYQNGLISETEYTDKQHDLLDVIRSNISATDDYKKELIDLYKEQMEKSNDALKENIRLHKERLQSQKDYWDYADSLKDKTKSINELEAQINALQGVFALSILIAGTS